MNTISIVTASYEQSHFLERCIRSVARQTVDADVEYLVVDGGSGDDTLDVIHRHEEHIDWWCSEPDDGPAAALNKGMQRATGSIMGCLNADDFYCPGVLAKANRAFVNHPDVDVIYGHGIMVDDAGRTICRIYSDRWDLERMLYGRCSVVQQGTFFRAKAFERAGGFNEENRTCWDAELLVDLAAEGANFRRLDAALGAFRMHETSISGSGRLEEEYRRDRKRIREEILGEVSPAAVKVKTNWFGAQRILLEPRLSLKRAMERIRRRVHRMRRGD